MQGAEEDKNEKYFDFSESEEEQEHSDDHSEGNYSSTKGVRSEDEEDIPLVFEEDPEADAHPRRRKFYYPRNKYR